MNGAKVLIIDSSIINSCAVFPLHTLNIYKIIIDVTEKEIDLWDKSVCVCVCVHALWVEKKIFEAQTYFLFKSECKWKQFLM